MVFSWLSAAGINWRQLKQPSIRKPDGLRLRSALFACPRPFLPLRQGGLFLWRIGRPSRLGLEGFQSRISDGPYFGTLQHLHSITLRFSREYAAGRVGSAGPALRRRIFSGRPVAMAIPSRP